MKANMQSAKPQSEVRTPGQSTIELLYMRRDELRQLLAPVSDYTAELGRVGRAIEALEGK